MTVHLSLDNGSKFLSRAFDAWADDTNIELRFIQPGRPVQNAHIESFNGRLRDECLNSHCFLTMRDARFHLERFRQSYNTDCPARACCPSPPPNTRIPLPVHPCAGLPKTEGAAGGPSVLGRRGLHTEDLN